MEKVELKPGIYWVGGIDWNLRTFHGYLTQRGTTYNAYLIVDDKITLVDTVKHYLFDEMLARISEIVDPSKIDIIVSNHVEMDHSGSIGKMLEIAPNAKVVTSVMGEKGLKRHYKQDWDFMVVKSGDTLNIGKRTLHFVHVPMVHWPDSMVTYIPEDKVLLPNDAFGQHIASAERFDDEINCWAVLKEEAAKYYANIVLPYGDQVMGAIKVLGDLDIEIIGPSHGVMWRSMIPELLEEYVKWATHTTPEGRAMIVYDTMWGSTKKMAEALREGLVEEGVTVEMRNLEFTDISDIMTLVPFSRGIFLASPTINNGMLPSMGGFLTYIKGLRPKNKVGFAFGSYGWGGQSVGEIEKVMEGLKWELPMPSHKINWVPDQEELDQVKQMGKDLAKHLYDNKE